MILTPVFFQRDTLVVARDLIGAEVYHKKGKQVTSGIIVETEAYLGRNDPASHSYVGETPRNAPMFREGGIAYVYFTYGNHHCFNVVTGHRGLGTAVLIRALAPKDGLGLMRRRRKKTKLVDLCSGPGKLTQALGMNLKQNGQSLRKKNGLWIEKSKSQKKKVVATPRIGISSAKEKLYRFVDPDSEYLSRVYRKRRTIL